MDVAVVRWPSEGERREALRDAGLPRVLLVEGDAAPPESECFEDWVRMPADDAELAARVRAVEARTRAHLDHVPRLDDDGLLWFEGRWVALTPLEVRLVEVLLERFGTVVGQRAMVAAGWPGSEARRNLLDVHMLKLRRRLAPAGLTIRTVRSRGYLLEAAASGS